MREKISKELKEKEKEIVNSFTKETVDRIMTPRNDFVFKKLFGTVGKERLVKDFLEAILGINIKSVELGIETILMPEEIDEKVGILDVRVKLEDGTDIDLEIQNAENSFIIKRAHFYASRMYSKQLHMGINYDKLKKVIVIFITNFVVFPNIKQYHTKWLVTEEQNIKEKFDEMELHFIELPKFLNTKFDKKRKIDQWLLFLDYSRREILEEIMEENENLKEAEENLEKIKQDKHMQYLAWLREKQILDSNSMKSEGIRIGRELGQKEGRETEKKEIVKNMLKEKIPMDIILRISGLEKEEIEKIEKDMKSEESND